VCRDARYLPSGYGGGEEKSKKGRESERKCVRVCEGEGEGDLVNLIKRASAHRCISSGGGGGEKQGGPCQQWQAKARTKHL